MRHALLALLAKGPAHGYELKRTLASDFGELWGELNIGQIYTTLARLERDGLVRAETVQQDSRPAKRVFSLTSDGHAAVVAWIDETLPAPKVRDEFFTKVVLAERSALGDPLALIDRQRRSYLRDLRNLQQLALTASTPAAELAVEGAALHLQADLAWLEKCEHTFATTRKERRA